MNKALQSSLMLAFSGLLLTLQTAQAGWKALPMQRKEVKKQLQARKIALVIGINQTKARYWTPLRYAAHDAVRISRSLRKLARFDKIMLRIRKQDTTKQALWHAIGELKQQVKSPLDTVLVYVSAHGTVAHNAARRGRERYIVTSDTTQHVDKTGMNVLRLVNQLKQLPSRKVVLMLATCYTGAPRSKSRTKPGHKGASMKGVKPLPTRALQILSASGYAQAAFESSDLRADVYTHFFLQCLQKLKKKGKNVSAIDAHMCAVQPTTRFVKAKLGEIQVPRVDSRPGANRDIFLLRDRQGPPVGYFWAGRKSPQVRYKLQRRGLAKGQEIPAQWALPGEFLALRPGVYLVTVRSRSGWLIRSYTITIRRGGISQLQLENAMSPRRRILQLQQSRTLIRALIYPSAGLLLTGGTFALVYGNLQNDSLPQIVGGIAGGIGIVWFAIAGLGELSIKMQLARIRLEQHHGYELPDPDEPLSYRGLPPAGLGPGSKTILSQGL